MQINHVCSTTTTTIGIDDDQTRSASSSTKRVFLLLTNSYNNNNNNRLSTTIHPTISSKFVQRKTTATTTTTINEYNSSNNYAANATSSYLPHVEWKHPILGIGLVLFSLITIFGNTLVICAVARERYLKSATNYYIASLALADLVVGLLVMPFNTVFEMSNYVWFFGQLWCDLWHSFDVFASTASINSLVIIALDRHSAISDPISYHTRWITRHWLFYVAGIWICSAIISFPAIAYWRRVVYSNPTNLAIQYEPYACKFTDDIYYLVFSSLVSFYIPLSVMIFVYIRIYRAATRQMTALKTGQKLNVKSADGTQLTLRIHRGGYHRIGGGTTSNNQTNSGVHSESSHRSTINHHSNNNQSGGTSTSNNNKDLLTRRMSMSASAFNLSIIDRPGKSIPHSNYLLSPVKRGRASSEEFLGFYSRNPSLTIEDPASHPKFPFNSGYFKKIMSNDRIREKRGSTGSNLSKYPSDCCLYSPSLLSPPVPSSKRSSFTNYDNCDSIYKAPGPVQLKVKCEIIKLGSCESIYDNSSNKLKLSQLSPMNLRKLVLNATKLGQKLKPLNENKTNANASTSASTTTTATTTTTKATDKSNKNADSSKGKVMSNFKRLSSRLKLRKSLKAKNKLSTHDALAGMTIPEIIYTESDDTIFQENLVYFRNNNEQQTNPTTILPTNVESENETNAKPMPKSIDDIEVVESTNENSNCKSLQTDNSNNTSDNDAKKIDVIYDCSDEHESEGLLSDASKTTSILNTTTNTNTNTLGLTKIYENDKIALNNSLSYQKSLNKRRSLTTDNLDFRYSLMNQNDVILMDSQGFGCHQKENVISEEKPQQEQKQQTIVAAAAAAVIAAMPLNLKRIQKQVQLSPHTIQFYRQHYYQHHLELQQTVGMRNFSSSSHSTRNRHDSTVSAYSSNSSSNRYSKAKLISKKMKSFNLTKKFCKFSREQKAAKTLGIVMGVFIICWLPFFIYNVITGIFKAKLPKSHEHIYAIFTWLGYINSGMNPVIYAFSSRDFRRAFYKILCPTSFLRNHQRLATRDCAITSQEHTVRINSRRNAVLNCQLCQIYENAMSQAAQNNLDKFRSGSTFSLNKCYQNNNNAVQGGMGATNGTGTSGAAAAAATSAATATTTPSAAVETTPLSTSFKSTQPTTGNSKATTPTTTTNGGSLVRSTKNSSKDTKKLPSITRNPSQNSALSRLRKRLSQVLHLKSANNNALNKTKSNTSRSTCDSIVSRNSSNSSSNTASIYKRNRHNKKRKFNKARSSINNVNKNRINRNLALNV